MSRECAITLVGWCLACPALAAGADAVRSIEVTDNTTLRAAMCEAKPGSRIRIAPGNYTGGLYVERLTGTERQPIVIEAHDPARPPVILGGTVGFHLPDAAHVTLCGLVFRGQSGNGVNIDDSGSYDTPAHHVSIEHVVFDAIGPKGN